MELANTRTRYGAVAKTFHWLVALLILAAWPLGYFASDLAHQITDPDIATTQAQADRAALLFSLHKTVGVAIFFTALARIAWALGQPKPRLLNGDRPVEARAAETAHWLLYGSLVAVPLSGWVSHAASTGFAPIWWPFGQSLPFVPKEAGLAETAATLHYILQWVLVGALAAHVAGALKHHLIDRDATLRRSGRPPASPAMAGRCFSRSPSGRRRWAAARRWAGSRPNARAGPPRSTRWKANGRSRRARSPSPSPRWEAR